MKNTQIERHQPSLPLDTPQQLALELACNLFTEEEREELHRTAAKTAAALVRGSSTSAAAQSILAKEVALRKVLLARQDALVVILTHELQHNPAADGKRLSAASQAAARQHRALLDAMEALRRYSTPEVPRVHISGNNLIALGGTP